MIPSLRCETMIEGFETFRAEAYLPTPDDVPTIGFGSTGPDIHLGMVWSMSQARIRFEHDLGRFTASLNSLVAGCVTTQNQFDALMSFVYNEGAENLRSSHLLAFHRRGDYVDAANEFSVWVYQKHKVLAGLVTRRAIEKALYLQP